MLYVANSVILGCGAGLFMSGRSSGSMAKMVGGVIFVVLGFGLFALAMLAEAKKANVI